MGGITSKIRKFRETSLLFQQEIALVPILAEYGNTLGPFEMEEYDASDVVRAFSEIEGTKIIAKGGTAQWLDWFEWKWRWELDESSLEIDFSLLEPESTYWGGSKLKPCCTFAELVRFWNVLTASHPVVSLHDRDCELLDQHAFLNKHALPPLERAYQASDADIRALAQKEWKVYRSLSNKEFR